jgi:hypothetical protein
MPPTTGTTTPVREEADGETRKAAYCFTIIGEPGR